MSATAEPCERLVLVLGDQLDADSAAFDGFRPDRDAVLMVEAREEACRVPQHGQRLVLFFSAMRHFREGLVDRGRRVHYVELEDPANRGSFAAEIPRWIAATGALRLVVLEPGDHRVLQDLERAADGAGCRLEVRPDRHFLCPRDDFDAYARGRRRLLMEGFYRRMRRSHGLLMEDGEPAGGRWNFDRDNRRPFGPEGPGEVPRPRGFAPDDLTRQVMAMVERCFPGHPGRLQGFDYPVTAGQARQALADFVEHRLARFGAYQDAMATSQPYLYHSRLSCVLNLHLLDPRDALAAAVEAWEDGRAPLNAVEGFVRQILGWREFVRGIYWREMPGYAALNALEADLPVPAFLWTGDTEMNCVRQCVGQLVEHAYAHHIQRLMVLGLFTMLLGARPYDVHRWHLSMYADAVDWVSLPNVLGMSQYGDGGIVGTKPYSASGRYIGRMSDYCRGCRFDPTRATGEDACPLTTLYWDFLSRNRNRIGANARMGFQFRNLDRKSNSERRAIRARAGRLRERFAADTYLPE